MTRGGVAHVLLALLGLAGCGRRQRTHIPRPDVASLALGVQASCALATDGAVYCWGRNEEGQLGTGAMDANVHPTPAVVAGIADGREIVAGEAFTCVLRANGTVACWGANRNGQLGRGDGTSSATPAEVRGLRDVRSLAAGATHACALRRSGQVVCWGNNGSGQLGVEWRRATASGTPIEVDW